MNSEFWKDSSPKEIIDFFGKLHQQENMDDWIRQMQEDQDFADLVFEYLWLYRSEAETRSLLNSEAFSSELLLKFIYFGYGKQLLLGIYESGAYFEQVKDMLNSEQSLRILSLAEEMDRDPTLKIHLLANLDPQTWEAYFDLLEQNSFTMQALLGIFSNLREKEIKKIFLNSPTLYFYLRMMMIAEVKEISKEELKERETLRAILDSIHVWELFCLNLKEKFNLELERQKSPRERNNNRLSLILRELVKVPSEERNDILAYIKGNKILIDESEESTILSLLMNYDKHGSFL